MAYFGLSRAAQTRTSHHEDQHSTEEVANVCKRARLNLFCRNFKAVCHLEDATETTRLCPYILEPTRLCPDKIVPRHFVPTHVCAQTRLCHTRLCPDTIVPRHDCTHTRLCPHMFVPRHLCPDML